MKTLNTPSPTSSTRRPKRPASPNNDYLPAAETAALLNYGLDARQRRLEADDMLSTDQAAEHVGTSRVTVNAWIAKGRAVGLTQTKRGFRLPLWQFEPAIWSAVPELAKALRTTEGWALLAFLESPLGALDGLTPREALERGQRDKVMQLAASEGN